MPWAVFAVVSDCFPCLSVPVIPVSFHDYDSCGSVIIVPADVSAIVTVRAPEHIDIYFAKLARVAAAARAGVRHRQKSSFLPAIKRVLFAYDPCCVAPPDSFGGVISNAPRRTVMNPLNIQL